VLVFDGWVESDTIRHGTHVPSLDNFASLGIPEFHHSVEGCRKEGGACEGLEGEIMDRLEMAGIRSHKFALMIDIPYLESVKSKI
jgi:hypothetical protein